MKTIIFSQINPLHVFWVKVQILSYILCFSLILLLKFQWSLLLSLPQVIFFCHQYETSLFCTSILEVRKSKTFSSDNTSCDSSAPDHHGVDDRPEDSFCSDCLGMTLIQEAPLFMIAWGWKWFTRLWLHIHRLTQEALPLLPGYWLAQEASLAMAIKCFSVKKLAPQWLFRGFPCSVRLGIDWGGSGVSSSSGCLSIEGGQEASLAMAIQCFSLKKLMPWRFWSLSGIPSDFSSSGLP